MSPALRLPDTLSHLEVDRLFATSLIEITRYRCRAAPCDDHAIQMQPTHLIAFPHSGAFELLQGDERTLIDSNLVLFHNAWVPYTTRHPVGGNDSGSGIAVREDVLLEMLARHDPGVAAHRERPFATTHAPISSQAVLQERLLLRHVTEAGVPDDLAVEEAALRLAAEAIAIPFRLAGPATAAVGRDAPRRRPLTESAKALLAARFTERLSLTEIAALLNASPFHLSRSFRKETGLTIHRYRTRLRLREALHRLWSSNTDLTTLALALGFDTHSHFTATFRREFGVPPRAVREVTVTGADLRRIVRELEADAARLSPTASLPDPAAEPRRPAPPPDR